LASKVKYFAKNERKVFDFLRVCAIMIECVTFFAGFIARQKRTKNQVKETEK